MGGHGGLNILPQKRWNGARVAVVALPRPRTPAHQARSQQSGLAGHACMRQPHACSHAHARRHAPARTAHPRMHAPTLPFAPPLRSHPAVYNRENRFKVAQDEAKAKAAEDEERGRHEQAEREARHAALLQRAAASKAGGLSVGSGTAALEGSAAAEAGAPAPLSLKRQRGSAGAGPSGAPGGLAAPAPQAPTALQHINFWAEVRTDSGNNHVIASTPRP